MTYYQDNYLSKIYAFNNEQRDRLAEAASKFETPEEKLKFVALYFVNGLAPEVIAKIDGTSISSVQEFKYDYSFLEDLSSNINRKREVRNFCNGSGFLTTTLNQGDCVRCGKTQVRIFPSFYAIKMGTCVMFANEIKRFAHEFGIDCDIVESLEYCYDNFNGKTTANKPLKTDQLVKMHHYYNVVTMNGEKLKLDIAGLLTAQDFNRNHPEAAVNLEDFFFSKNIKAKPFEEANKILKAAQPNNN